MNSLIEKGYNLRTVDTLDLEIQHCLMVPKHIKSLEEIEGVMSKQEALEQCGKFLDAIVSIKNRVPCGSTGEAAENISRMDKNTRMAAIAPRIAAKEYGLKILSDKIQDDPNNMTQFVLLENDTELEKLCVGIIGIRGLFGQMLKKFFEKHGCEVIGSDAKHNTGLSNTRVAQLADVVIFSIPISETPVVIRTLLPWIREDQLLMDVTSIKGPAIEAMLESKAQVVGLHPMFRPDVPFDGQTVVVCPARLHTPWHKRWVMNVLIAMKADIKWSTAQEHDAFMTMIQVLPHLGNLVSALVIEESNVSVSESLSFASPIYRVIFALMGRLVGQNPNLFTSIIMENPQTIEMLKKRIEIETRLLTMIEEKDQLQFEALFEKAKSHFGAEVITDANELFTGLLGFLNTRYCKNLVILEFAKSESRPGLLAKVTEIFMQKSINLSGINFVDLDEKRQRLLIKFDDNDDPDLIGAALAEIEQLENYKIKVVNGR